jgi:glycosyltransferase involved in cell wall biosynthesis
MLYSIEKPQTDYSKLKDFFDEKLMTRIRFLEVPQGEEAKNKLFKVIGFLKSVLFDIGEAGIRDIMHLGVLRNRHKYEPAITYFKNFLLERFADYDVVHMGAWHALYTYAASKLKNILNFKTCVHSFYHGASSGIMELNTCVEVLSKVNAVTTSTIWEKEYFERLGVPNVYFIGECVDIERIENETAKMPKEENEFTVIYIGAKNHEKGYFHALLAMNEFAKKVGYKNVQMICIGRGSLFEAPSSLRKNVLEAYHTLKRHGTLEDYMFVSEAEKLWHLKRAHVVLLPSKVETIPLVTLEAWVLKKPSILCNIPTVKSVIRQDGNGAALINFGDINGTVKTLEKFYKNRDSLSSVGIKGHDVLMQYGTPKKVSTRLLHVYEKALTSN